MAVNGITRQMVTFYCKSALFLSTVSFKSDVVVGDFRSRERQRVRWGRIV